MVTWAQLTCWKLGSCWTFCASQSVPPCYQSLATLPTIWTVTPIGQKQPNSLTVQQFRLFQWLTWPGSTERISFTQPKISKGNNAIFENYFLVETQVHWFILSLMPLILPCLLSSISLMKSESFVMTSLFGREIIWLLTRCCLAFLFVKLFMVSACDFQGEVLHDETTRNMFFVQLIVPISWFKSLWAPLIPVLLMPNKF